MALDLDRIHYLLGDSPRETRIGVVGLGSGGFPVVQHLAMSGWRRFTLVDPDSLGDENLVKHPARREQIGSSKVDIVSSWLKDRNPDVDVRGIREDVSQLGTDWASDCALVVCAVDDNGARHWINDSCLQTRTTMTLGMVHRGGVGGSVLCVRPGETGCYACLELTADTLAGLPSDEELPLTSLETRMIYGRGIRGFGAPGLSADIALVAAVHAQVTIAELLRIEGTSGSIVKPPESNWISIRLRSDGVWAWGFSQFDLPPISGCVSCGAPDE